MTPTAPSDDIGPVPSGRTVVVPGQLALFYEEVNDDIMSRLCATVLDAVAQAFLSIEWEDEHPSLGS